MEKVRLTLGDWSCDGHNISDQFVYFSNKPVKEIQDAYKTSCKLTGLSFNHNEDYTGLNLSWNHPETADRKICTEYEDSEISPLAKRILMEHGINSDGILASNDFDPVQSFIEIWIEFVKLSLKDLVLEEVSFKKSELKEIPAINGWWNEELNVQFGYGLYI